MTLQFGLVGLPNAGKSTLFNALTKLKVPAANYPFCTVEPNVGMVPYPDERLNEIASQAQSKKVTPTMLKFVDIAGLVKGASKGEGLGNRFLGNIREMDAIIHVVRSFGAGGDVSHPYEKIDPARDMDLVNLELCLADLETIEKRLEKSEKLLRAGDKEEKNRMQIFQKAKENLAAGNRIASIDSFGKEEKEILKDLFLLTEKPVLYALNVNEDIAAVKESGLSEIKRLKEKATKENARLVTISALLEAELSDLDEEEKELMMEEYSLEEEGLFTLIRESYELMNLRTFFTIKGEEARAWTIEGGVPAVEAAGKIHTDMMRGFIKAEVIEWQKYLEAKSLSLAREKGWLSIEGKDYEVKDGDIIYFKFNV